MELDDKFRFEITRQGDAHIVFLKGVIDEDADFSAMKRISGPVAFNFKELESINSCGVRAWVNLIKELGNRGIRYEECSPLIVRQMNMVPSFLGPAQVQSVYVPYVCSQCEAEKNVLYEKTFFWKTNLNVKESFPCDVCRKGEMEIDGHPKQYFSFAK